jgi:hypothetical protein
MLEAQSIDRFGEQSFLAEQCEQAEGAQAEGAPSDQVTSAEAG